MFSNARGKCDRKQYAKAVNSLDAISHPYLCINGLTTPAVFLEALAGTSRIEDGFINRSIPILSEERGAVQEDAKLHLLPVPVLDWAKHITLTEIPQTDPATPHVIPVDEDAWAHLRMHQGYWDRRKDGLYARAAENSLKLAGLVAFGLDPMRVNLPLMEWAVDVVNDAYSRFLDELPAEDLAWQGGDSSDEQANEERGQETLAGLMSMFN